MLIGVSWNINILLGLMMKDYDGPDKFKDDNN